MEKTNIPESICESDAKNFSLNYQGIIEFMPDATFAIDRDGKVVAWNRAMEEMTGVRKKEMLGKGEYAYAVPFYGKQRPMLIDFALSNHKEIEQFYDQVTQKGSTLSCELVVDHLSKQDLAYHWVKASPIFDEKGDIVGAIETIRDITKFKKSEEKLKDTFQVLEQTTEGIICTISKIIKKRDPYTAGHQVRVAELSSAIAREIGLSSEKVDSVRLASQIHDIGKINVPAEILSKPGKINEFEFGIIKNHPLIGEEIMEEIDFPWPISQIIVQHHERIDGSGYPFGLKNGQIQLEAKILGVADAVEAMSSHRPYRPALGTGQALEEIQQKKGAAYDSDIVDACVKLFREKGFCFKYQGQ